MTRAYAARQLLRLGPLTLGEFVTCTGWPIAAARKTLAALVEAGQVVYRGNTQRGVYEVPAHG
ncbi:hypothetical protein [Xenophilus sp. Marseille-Q4582]|uniref:hypothetical protein n=1 Tax=Xenophilus sp. Marseille-Q4582 TaxID=2866600 RepID=UPI001CE4ABF6|nr:hypothetical protein [Xenophilus sp. Marseille-Q4582]